MAKVRSLKQKTTTNSKKRHLAYIMGPNYSGSTLLTLLLANHPQIATVGELKATSMGDVETYNCSCGDLLKNCRFWREVQHKAHQQDRNFSFDNFSTHFRSPDKPFTDLLLRASFRGSLFEMARATAFHISPISKKIRKSVVEQNQVLIEIITGLQGGGTFLDDSKEPIRLKFLLAADLWDIKVLQLIRDGRGVTNSYMRHNNTTMSKAAREWVHTQQECDRMKRILGEKRCKIIHYEDLCRNPQKTLAGICTFLDLDPNTLTSSNKVKHIMGNQMRLGNFKDVKLDVKWKTTLSADNLEVFSATAGRLNYLHGYF